MAISTISSTITDPTLLPLLQTSQEALASCQRLVNLLSQLPTDANPDVQRKNQLALSAGQKQLYAVLSLLRQQNRTAVLGVRATKQATAEARQEIDRLHLQLQNLYYEQRHLMGEIEACESYEHPHTHLPLIPLDEFLSLSPDHATLSPNDLMIARINHEHAEREKLEAARQDLLKRKQVLIAENKKRKDDLRNLDHDLERFIDAARPIQRIFEVEH